MKLRETNEDKNVISRCAEECLVEFYRADVYAMSNVVTRSETYNVMCEAVPET